MIGVGHWQASPEVYKNIVDVLDSGRISYGKYSKTFEDKFADFHGNSFGVLSNSGTSSLLVALQTLKEINGWQDGDEVLVPASTFVATYNIVLQNRLKPVLVDVDPEHFLIDAEDVRRKITPKTRCVIPVHLFGQPADLETLYDVIGYYAFSPISVIEDSCECMGLNSIARSDITCFSFYVAHIITCGVGGMALTNNSEYSTYMRSLVNHGRNNIYISIDDGKDRLDEVIGKRFEFERVGHSFRITELEAAIGVAQLEQLDDWLCRRRSNAEILTKYLNDERITRWLQLPYERIEGEHAWMMYPIVCDNWEIRNGLVHYLEERGIETRDALPLITQPVYNSMLPTYPGTYWPNAYRLATKGFYVGCHQYLNGEDMAKIAQVVRDYYAAR